MNDKTMIRPKISMTKQFKALGRSKGRGLSPFPALLLLLSCIFTAHLIEAGEVNLGTEAQREAGKKLYQNYCAHCHGDTGDGDGIASLYFNPKPRDFTSGKYKIRTTDSGELPTDGDIRKVIDEGMPYTGMPAFPGLNDEEITELIYYLKTFNEDFTDPDFIVDPLEFRSAPAYSEESAELGREVYVKNECYTCHGDTGRTDGVSAPTLEDDNGIHIRAADLTKRWTFRGGSSREDIYRTFTTGLNGTPMPSYADSIPPEDRWRLVDYIYSLSNRDESQYSIIILAEPIEGDIDLSRGKSLFEDATAANFPIVGQVILPGREFFPSVTELQVSAVYNAEEIAILVAWNDMMAETESSNALNMPVEIFHMENRQDQSEITEPEDNHEKFSDAVAMQFPRKMPAGFKKPYFLYGDLKNTVDISFVDLAQQAEVKNYTGNGIDLILPAEKDDVSVLANYDNGEWTVIFKRNREAKDRISFAEETFIPIAFSVWDGFNQERGTKAGITSWYSLYLKPMETESLALPMALNALWTLAAELLVILLVRKKYASRFTSGMETADTA